MPCHHHSTPNPPTPTVSPPAPPCCTATWAPMPPPPRPAPLRPNFWATRGWWKYPNHLVADPARHHFACAPGQVCRQIRQRLDARRLALMVWTRKQTTLLQGHLGELGHRVEVRHAMTYGNPGVAQDGQTQGRRLPPACWCCPPTRSLAAAPPPPRCLTSSTAGPAAPVMCPAALSATTTTTPATSPRWPPACANTGRPYGQPDKLVMSFHGARGTLHLGDPYHCRCHKTGRLLVPGPGRPKRQCTWSPSSRAGKAKWLEPHRAHSDCAGPGEYTKVDVICPSFTGDCLETLEEISMEAREAFRMPVAPRSATSPA